MKAHKKTNIVDKRLFVLAYAQTNDFVNSDNAGGVTFDKVLKKVYGEKFGRTKFFDQYCKNELGKNKRLHLLGTNN